MQMTSPCLWRYLCTRKQRRCQAIELWNMNWRDAYFYWSKSSIFRYTLSIKVSICITCMLHELHSDNIIVWNIRFTSHMFSIFSRFEPVNSLSCSHNHISCSFPSFSLWCSSDSLRFLSCSRCALSPITDCSSWEWKSPPVSATHIHFHHIRK